jgi:predicted nucleic acid-binding protein
MDTSVWLSALVGLGLLAIGLMAAFVRFCDRI